MSAPNDLTLISDLGDGEHTACLMSVRSLLDGRGLTDQHPSRVIRSLGIAINNRPWWRDDAERTAVLMPVALDERLCASRVVVTPEIERARAYRCVDTACRVWAPRALRAAGLVADAERLEALAPVVDGQTAYDTSAVARAATSAAARASDASDAHAASAAAYAATGYAASAAAHAAHAAPGYATSAAAHATDVAAATGYAARSEAIALLLELCEVQS